MRACPEAELRKVAALKRVRETTDPFALSQRIAQHLERLWALATRAPRTPREAAPRVAAAAGDHPVARLDSQPHGAAPEAGAEPSEGHGRGDTPGRTTRYQRVLARIIHD